MDDPGIQMIFLRVCVSVYFSSTPFVSFCLSLGICIPKQMSHKSNPTCPLLGMCVCSHCDLSFQEKAIFPVQQFPAAAAPLTCVDAYCTSPLLLHIGLNPTHPTSLSWPYSHHSFSTSFITTTTPLISSTSFSSFGFPPPLLSVMMDKVLWLPCQTSGASAPLGLCVSVCVCCPWPPELIGLDCIYRQKGRMDEQSIVSQAKPCIPTQLSHKLCVCVCVPVGTMSFVFFTEIQISTFCYFAHCGQSNMFQPGNCPLFFKAVQFFTESPSQSLIDFV